MTDYENQRAQQIARNKALIRDLGIQSTRSDAPSRDRPPVAKKRKIRSSDNQAPSRSSARIASAPSKPVYNEDEAQTTTRTVGRGMATKKGSRTAGPKTSASTASSSPPPSKRLPAADLDALQAGWTSWTATAPEPTRTTYNGPFHFASHPAFTPNKSPSEMLREGVFGGSYFRSLYSARLGITVSDDWRELPNDWIEGLDIKRFLTSPDYDAEINKYGVACGQSIEAWEAAGWIDHQYDVRGWFQWYCRFFMGRRCEDDDRQVSRWARCVGERGRWRRALLKKYGLLGIRSVFADEGGGDDDEDAPDVSPVVHQTCFQWGWQVDQPTLDSFWQAGGR